MSRHFLCASVLLLAGLLNAGYGQAEGPKKAEKGVGSNRWALLIGVDDYAEAEKLHYCSADMRSLRDQLVSAGFPQEQVFLLDDGAKENKYRPLKANIQRQLELVLGLVERDDILVLGFSGHGVHIDGKSYLCPSEARLGDTHTMVAMDDVYDRLQKCPATLKLLLVDACRNDPRPSGQKSLIANDLTSRFATALERPPEGILLLTSCAPGQVSLEESDFSHGVFMHFVLEGLQGAADEDGNGYVSLLELYKYANKKTKAYAARKFNSLQTPALKGDLHDDFNLTKAVAIIPARSEPGGTMPQGSQPSRPLSPGPEVAGPARTFDGELAGTVWNVVDSDGDHHVFMFQAGGELHYQSPRAFSKAATWKKEGDSVTIDINEQFATLQGTISGATISGTGRNRNGRAWTWQATLK